MYTPFEVRIAEVLRELDSEWPFGLRGAVKTRWHNGEYAARGSDLKVINQAVCERLNRRGFVATEPAPYGDGKFANLQITSNENVGLWLETQLAYSAHFSDDNDPDYRSPKPTMMNGLWSKKVSKVFSDCATLARVEHDLAAALLIAFAHNADGFPSEDTIRRYVEEQWKFRKEVQDWRLVDLSAGGIKKSIDAAPNIRFVTRVWMIERPSKARVK